MRKYIIGAIFGAALTFSATAYGDDLSKIGQKVTGEYAVVVDGATLPQKAVGVEGSTYAPLRSIGEQLGYDVRFENKTVIFEAKEVESVPTETPESSPTGTQTEQKYTKSEIENGIAEAENGIHIWGKLVEGFDSVGRTDKEAEKARETLKGYKDQLEFWQSEKAKLEAVGK